MLRELVNARSWQRRVALRPVRSYLTVHPGSVALSRIQGALIAPPATPVAAEAPSAG